MESIYYVISWVCHRRCKHCYDDRYRPYSREALPEVINKLKADFPRIVDNLPERMTYIDLERPSTTSASGYDERPGRIVLSGGEVLVDPVREEILYPLMDRLVEKYAQQNVRIIIQTAGDLITPKIIDELLAHGMWMVTVSGMDDYHHGMEGDKRIPIKQRLTRDFEKAGMCASTHQEGTSNWNQAGGPFYRFFGANPESWLGKVWPRGRAWSNSLSTATMQDNFCNNWSGALNFLNAPFSGSEVSVAPDGNVHPCCMRTTVPLGNLVEERMEDILESLTGNPAFEALSMGHPERMGINYGWDTKTFIENSKTTKPNGEPFHNLCVGCDRFHEEVLGDVSETLERSD